MSKHSVRAGDIAALLARFSELKRKASERTGKSFPIVVIQEAGLDGFWLHRVLQGEGVESYVVDPASIATSRRQRRAKTDRIDGEALLRALLAYRRGEPRVCAMVKAPTPEEEDRCRLCRERKDHPLTTLLAEATEPLQRRNYVALRSLTGVAPVTKRSGKSCIVVRRQACNDRLANAIYQWARVDVQHGPRSRAKYAELRRRGHTHGRALRSIGDRLLNVACAMLKSGATFNPSLAAQNTT